MLLKKLPTATIALLLQAIAYALTLSSITLSNLVTTPLAFALLCGLIAMTLSYFARLAKWWLLIQFLFIPAMVLVLALNIPSGYFLAAFLITLVVYWNTFRGQVPLYLSSNKVREALVTLLPSGNIRFVDLGSGLGGVLTYLASMRPDGNFTGVESAPLPWLWSWLRIRVSGYRQCRVCLGSLWDCDLSQYDIVFAYLSPAPMERLWQKARTEMQPGSVFISSTFSVPEQAPHQTLATDDLHNSTLLIWRM
ncbi:MAG: class I SAM-dependent methyltransferase [Gallionella sp.]